MGRNAAHDFYPEFLRWLTYNSGIRLGRYLSRDPNIVPAAVHKCKTRLEADGIADAEIERREYVIRTAFAEREDDF